MIFFSKIRTWEPGAVLGNLDLNRSLVWNPYSGTWTRTRLCTHPYSFLYSWPNIDGTYGKHLKNRPNPVKLH